MATNQGELEGTKKAFQALRNEWVKERNGRVHEWVKESKEFQSRLKRIESESNEEEVRAQLQLIKNILRQKELVTCVQVGLGYCAHLQWPVQKKPRTTSCEETDGMAQSVVFLFVIIFKSIMFWLISRTTEHVLRY